MSITHSLKNQSEVERVKKCGAKIFMGRLDGSLLITKSFGDFSFKSHVKIFHLILLMLKRVS